MFGVQLRGPATAMIVSGAVLACLLPHASANAFRGTAKVTTGRIRAEQLRAAMLDELMAALGHGNRVTTKRLEDLEEALKPMFQALPRNEHDNLDHAAVRYALHRLFVLRHGMYIKGLEPGGGSFSGASVSEVLDDIVPAYVQSLFEERLDGHGLGLHEVSILAATLEHLIHDEANTRLKAAYSALDFPLERSLKKRQVEDVVDTYMVLFLLGEDGANMSSKSLLEKRSDIASIYPPWPESRAFTRKVQQNVTDANAQDSAFSNGKFTFNATSLVIEEIMERYGRWQDAECQDLKAALTKLESKTAGHVMLKDFYGSAKDGAWQFTESVPWLRDLGALDESDGRHQSVIIPNYINSRSNCLASSSIYSVCCLNECEPLLGHLEREIGAPEAAPERVLDVVSKLPSATIPAPRTLPSELVSLLEEVASHHGGVVPLHGRLFGQWLHHAFPRECPYPHKAGSTNPRTASEWLSEGNGRVTVTDEEIQKHIQAAANCSDAGTCDNSTSTEVKPLMWTAEEELIVSRPAPPRKSSGLITGAVTVLAVASFCWSLVRSSALSRSHTKGVLPFAGKVHSC